MVEFLHAIFQNLEDDDVERRVLEEVAVEDGVEILIEVEFAQEVGVARQFLEDSAEQFLVLDVHFAGNTTESQNEYLLPDSLELRSLHETLPSLQLQRILGT
jgi:hypothetical protein